MTLNIDWNSVKKQTLWSYEDLIRKLQDTLEYGFVQEYYNHPLLQAREYAGKIRFGYLQDKGEMTGYIDGISAHLEKLETRWSGTTSYLVGQVATRDDCVAFLQRTGFKFDALIQVLNYLMRWVLPFKNPIREFIDVDTEEGARHLEALKKYKLGSNLDLLESGRKSAGRAEIAGHTGIPLDDVIALVHKADISRLAYVRGATVRHLYGGGFDTLEKIASARLAEMEIKMDAYYRTLGKSLADFKAVIPLEWMIGGAQVLPRVVEEG
jgi:hypothetical protein